MAQAKVKIKSGMAGSRCGKGRGEYTEILKHDSKKRRRAQNKEESSKTVFPNWFGKGCEHLVAQWEETEYVGGPNYMEYEPVLKFCKHELNPSETEGNCNPRQCPL